MNTLKNLSKILALALLLVFSQANVSAQCSPGAGSYTLSTTPYNGVWDFTTGGLSWNTYVVQTGTTVVFTGASAQFPENSKIEVQPGGELIIDNSSMTSTCSGNKWIGIEVHGNPAQPFSTTNGFVNILNSQVSNALIAVNLIDNGGAQIYTSSFTNNDIGVKIVGNGSSGGYPWAFYEDDFDWNYIDPTMSIAHIYLEKVDGMGIYGCNFSNSSTSTVNVPAHGSLDYLQRGVGINHKLSEFLVTNSGAQGTCGDVTGGRKSTFRDLGVGIYMSDYPNITLTNQMVAIDYSKFVNNFWGVFSDGERIYDVQNNRFEFTDGTDYFTAGAVNVWSGHVVFGHDNNPSHTNIVNNNTFETYQNSNFSVGVAGEWSSFDYHVRNNIFIHGGDIQNSWGVRFDFMNPSPPVSKITCNKFVGTDIDIALYNCTGTNQIGDVNDPANNIFSNTNISIDIIGNLPFPIVAYYKNTLSPAPVNSINAVPVINSNNVIVKCRLCEIQPSIAPEEGKGDKAQPGKIGIAGSNAQSTTHSWKEFPAPGTGNYTLLPIDNHLQGNVTLKVFDIAGKEILNTTADGAKEILVDISTQPSGIYIYHITQNGQTYFTGKLIKE